MDRVRGGAVAVKVGLNAEHLGLPEDSADVMVCFDWEKYQELAPEFPLKASTLLLYDGDPPGEINLPPESFRVDFSLRSREVTGSTQNKNLVALGLLKRILAFPDDRVKETIKEDAVLVLLKENPSIIEVGEQLFS